MSARIKIIGPINFSHYKNVISDKNVITLDNYNESLQYDITMCGEQHLRRIRVLYDAICPFISNVNYFELVGDINSKNIEQLQEEILVLKNNS